MKGETQRLSFGMRLLIVPLCLVPFALEGAEIIGIRERFQIADEEYRRALAGDGDWEQVLAYYRHLAEHSVETKDQERAYFGLAESYLAIGAPWRAVFALDQAIALNGDRQDWALFRKGMTQMIEADEASSRAKSRTARREAVETYQRIADEFPESRLAPQALFFVANNYLIHFRRSHTAEDTYRELIERYPNSKEAEVAVKILPVVHQLTDKQLAEMAE